MARLIFAGLVAAALAGVLASNIFMVCPWGVWLCGPRTPAPAVKRAA